MTLAADLSTYPITRRTQTEVVEGCAVECCTDSRGRNDPPGPT
jgi:hypothetical protein